MRRVAIIGSPGSGKSTLARRLRDLSGLPLHYLDLLWHLPDGDHVTRAAFDARTPSSCLRSAGSSTGPT